MLQTLRALPDLLRTPIGRNQLRFGLRYRAWPLMSRLALAHRLTLSRKTCVIAVVGSLGKTTTTRAVLTALDGRPPARTNLNAYGGLAAALLKIRPTDRHAVVEVGISKPGDMAQYARVVRPSIAVVTSIASEHNRSFHSLEVTRAEKSEMVRALPRSGLAILNGDDPNVRWMRERTRAAVKTFGLNDDNDVRASELTLDWPNGTTFKLHVDGTTRAVRSRLLGRHQVYPLLAAVTVARALGLDLDRALAALGALRPTPGRLEVLPLPNGAFLLRDEYKSPAESIDAALDVLADIPASRRIVVLGDVAEPLGPPRAIYRRLGERVGQIADRAIFVGGGFRSYSVGAKRGGLTKQAIVDAGRGPSGVIDALSKDLAPGDVVLIKGRSTQRLDRVALALAGRSVKCRIQFCDAVAVRCDTCPMLERGWDSQRAGRRANHV